MKFILDTDTKELYANNQAIEITKGHYELLLFLVQNPRKMFTKHEVLDKVWKGKYVTENSIDQIISKLRKVLSSVDKQTYIKTVYGKGFMFVPEVNISKDDVLTTQKNRQKVNSKIVATAIMFSMILLFGFLFFNKENKVESKPDSLLLIMSSANASGEVSKDDKWLNQASGTLIDQLFSYANVANLKDYKNKPEYLDRQQYIQTQWKISPDLKVVTTHIAHSDNIFTVELNLVDSLQKQVSQSFPNQNLSTALTSASQWLINQINSENDLSKIESLIPQNSYVLELYMHGLASLKKGEIEKADKYFQLCLGEDPEFNLARLQLAEVKNVQGKHDKSLALLETLATNDLLPQMKITIANLRGDIYDTQGKYEQARDLYLSILEKFKDNSYSELDETRYNLSYTYATMTNYDDALAELNILENKLKVSLNPELLAHVLQKKASILQKLGHMQPAKRSAERSLDIFSKLEDLLGEAKIYSTLARITTHQSNYKKSIQYLEQALFLNKSLKYKLGIGATINELIYVLMVQGHYTKAWLLNEEMHDIAIDIDYGAMLQISKQYSVDISRAQQKWKRAELYLQEHLQLAKSSNNKRAILKNKLLALDFYLDQDISDNVEELIQDIQTHIDETGELRLQPRIDKHLARYYLLINKQEQAIALLQSTKDLARKTEDGEIIIEINNILAEYYIKSNQAQKSLAVLEGSSELNPMAYPYLLLKAKANHIIGNNLLALDLINECKNLANENWSLEDERYLLQLQNN